MAGARFGSRMGMMLVMLGMAVGTGNIWRFPRIAAQNGGGEFLVAWVVFLFAWSIPLVLLEFGMGRKLRCGPIRAFGTLLGPRFAWMGAFCVFVTAAIAFYYSVVAGWTFRFAAAALVGELPGAEPEALWDSFTTSWWPAIPHALAVGFATVVVARGVNTIERVAKILMPALLVLVLILTGRALTLPGAGEGLDFLFSVDWSALGNARLWVEALTQNAWDTGAGWGLVLCYAAYLREKEDTVQNAFVLPTANNLISLVAGVMVMCTIFSVIRDESVREEIFNQSNEGLTFIWMPQLFATLLGGRWLMVLFFTALAFAAVTSLISMFEVASRALVDAGVERTRAVYTVGAAVFLFGLPSVASIDFLRNQDWVWGVSLMLSGLFFAIAGIACKPRAFREEHLNQADSKWRVGRWWDFVIGVLVPVQAVVLFIWMLVQAMGWEENWLDPFGTTNVGTVLFQVGLVFLGLILANRWIAQRSLSDATETEA